MEEMVTEKTNEEVEIDLQRIVSAVLERIWIVIVVSLVGAVLSLFVTHFLITPQYEAAAMFYVNNNSISVGDASLSISSGDLTTSRNLVDSYIVILNTRETINDVIDYAGIDSTYKQVKEMISAAAVNETEIFEVTVTNPDPKEAELIANAIAYILPKRIGTIIEGTSAKVVDAAVIPSSPSSPSYTKNILLGFLMGLVLSAGLIVLQEILDVTIRSEDDVKMVSKYPILAAVPDMAAPGKGGHYDTKSDGKRGKKQNQRRRFAGKKPEIPKEHVGDDIPFVASEAYKLLRTKIQFSFADDSNCHVIGVSSALAGEGKSTTSVNLACALAKLKKRVLLVDCDLRRPSVAAKMKIDQTHGLSGYLTRQSTVEQIIQEYRLKGGVGLLVIPAGEIPPNPTELLNSPRMERFMERFASRFDYVILDLPPVEEVSDALVAAKLADGVLLAVRQNYCNRIALEDTIRQFEFVKGRILGFLITCSTAGGTGYGKSYYKRYYRPYSKYHQYAKAYEQSFLENFGDDDDEDEDEATEA